MAAPATRMTRKPDLRIDPEADAAAGANEAIASSSPRTGAKSEARPKTPQAGPTVRIQKHSMALLRKAFNTYDEEHSGSVPVSAVGVALWSCGIAVPAGEEINDVLSSIVPDFDPESKVTFDHFLQVARDLEHRNYASSPRPVDYSRGGSPEPSPRSPKSPGKAPGRRKSLSRRAVMSDTWEAGADDEQLLATLRQLEEQRKMYEDEGNYQEASRIAKRIQELKVGEESKRMAAMDERQTQELGDAEAAYRAEVEETNALWDDKMAQFQESVTEQAPRLS
ncbi:hypothetical protein KFL_001080075 [Klebsormidium nitens]|uniref:EF-hand domain-containing protein n=1 Tax=Klebsormidium nitens TaxID=105231 RepID=A0A1Y1HX25_KLENI|nr:hypothetical protein KFL_001080075 [Klebsormidium nitens]|eukprot:GAQ82332.1 hypothetical protein KFL_001080075 [Klebsormidium nitens]